MSPGGAPRSRVFTRRPVSAEVRSEGRQEWAERAGQGEEVEVVSTDTSAVRLGGERGKEMGP